MGKSFSGRVEELLWIGPSLVDLNYYHLTVSDSQNMF